MLVTKIAFTNMFKNFQSYLLHFVSISMSILIFFTFMSLANNPLIRKIFLRWEVIGSSLFSSSAFVLILFVAFFIFYSNSYFLKRRKRELGLYSLLGLRKGQVCAIWVIENLLVYLLALIAGIVAGIFFSKLFSMLLFWLVNLRVNTAIIFSGKAIMDTILVFLVIMAYTSLYACGMVFRYSLLQLFQNKDMEKSVPRGSITLTIIGLCLIGFGYALALQNIEESFLWHKLRLFPGLCLVLLSVVAGTWLVIRFSMPLGLRFFYGRKNVHYYGTNLLTITSLRYRLKRNANTLAMIAVLSATTLTIIGAIGSFYSEAIHDVKRENPSIYQILNLTPNKQKEVDRIIRRSSENKLQYATQSAYLNVPVKNPLKRMPYEFYANEDHFSIISENEFNRLNKIESNRNLKISGLRDGEGVLVGSDITRLPTKLKKGLQNHTFFLRSEDKAKELESVQFVGFREFPLFNTGFADFNVVVNQNVYNKLLAEFRPEQVFIYDVSEVDHSEKLGNRIQQAVEGKVSIWSNKISSYFSNYHIVSILTGAVLFVGVFIGIVFFLATGSIIYFKQVTDAYSEEPGFRILFKLGLTDRELRQIIVGQIGPVFIVPLLFGISHSIIAMIGLAKNFEVAVKLPFIIVTSIYYVFYGVYYWLTANNYRNIVSRHRHD